MSVRYSSPAAARNVFPILDVLATMLPAHGLVLEVASGSGQHATAFARNFPHLRWQPSDADPIALASIEDRRAEAQLDNLLAPILLDAAAAHWPIVRADALVCINMVHISPWPTTLRLLDGAAHLLGPGAPLCLYGPYRRAGVPTAASNEEFDRSLKARDPEWGLRDLEMVTSEAEARGFRFDQAIDMPANNLSVTFRRVETAVANR